MADNPSKAKTCVKSGVTNTGYVPILGGNPPKKNVEEIDRVNRPKKAPGSTRA